MSDKKSTSKTNRKKGKFLKIFILALVLTLAAVGGLIISDMISSKNEEAPKSETVTVTVSGRDIFIDGKDKVTLRELDDYFTNRFDEMDYCTIALINDTANPADIDKYNEVVELLKKFGFNHEPITLPATNDELYVSSSDEV
ncbi:MAG: hypothetical protein E7532_05290 [Ruminococcaceae bacterium]|nr:hypothetical protein [Oscillospiraceae bacterium]